MSDVNLLAFGCAVSFIVVAGFYVYLRECWTTEEERDEREPRSEDAEEEVLRQVF